MSYQRYMKGMSNGGRVSSFDNATPLTDEELRAYVPSLFATEAHESRSDRFVPIPTVHVLNALRAADFYPVFAQQARTRVPGKAAYTRHMLRLRHKSLSNDEGRAFEVILTNANDGTASYQMLAGIFRFVCANGLFTGETFAPVQVRHAGRNVIESVQEGALDILRRAPEALDWVDRMRKTPIAKPAAIAFAEMAHRQRFPRAYEEMDGESRLNPDKVPVLPVDLLRPRRFEDNKATVWHVYNIVQENTVKGGQRGYIVGTNGKIRRAKVREVTAINENKALNRVLWDSAVNLVENGALAA